MDVTVIDLDRDAPPASAPSRPPAHLLRPLGLALAVLLALALGGAVPVVVVLWQPLGSITLADPEAAVLLAGDRIYTVATGPAGQRTTTTAWDAASLTERWSAGMPISESAAGVTLTVADDGLLLTGPAYASTMIDADTGTVRWTRPAPVQPVGAGLGVSRATYFRAGTEYDQAGGEPGGRYFSSTGRPHTEPPRHTTVYGLDLSTGERLWADDERGSAHTVPVPGEAGAVVVASAGRLTLRDARTGAVRREAELTLPRATGVSWVAAAGDLLLVRRGSADGGGTVSGYRMSTLQPLWQIGDPPDDGRGGACRGLPCRRDRDGMTVLDPRTGRPQWHTDAGLELTAWAGGVLEVDAASGGPIQLRDRATGVPRVPLRGWHRAVVEPGQPLLLTRVESDFRQSTFGVLRPGSRLVQPIGFGPTAASDCRIARRFVACRDGDGVAVWAYRA